MPVFLRIQSERVVVAAAVVVHIIAAWFSEGQFNADEYWQVLGFAAYKLGYAAAEEMVWEFDHAIRPALQPFIAYLMSQLVADPFVAAFMLRLLSAILALVGCLFFLRAFVNDDGGERSRLWVLLFTLLLWSAVFFHVRFSAENWGGALFLLGLGLSRRHGGGMPVVAGFVFGLAFVARYQVGIMIAGFVLWLLFIQRAHWQTLALLTVGGAAAVVAGMALDFWFYGKAVFTAWNYLNFNLLQSGIEGYSQEPWWHYAEKSVLYTLPPLSVIVPVVVVLFWWCFPRHPLTWITLPFVVFHHFIGHKEIRFLMPVLAFLPLMTALVVTRLGGGAFFRGGGRIMWRASVVINAALLPFAMFMPADIGQRLVQHVMTQLPATAVIAVHDEGMAAGEIIQNYYLRDERKRFIRVRGADALAAIAAAPPPLLYYATRKNRDEALRAAGLVFRQDYIAYPRWVRAFNINDWQSRASIWRLYLISAGNS